MNVLMQRAKDLAEHSIDLRRTIHRHPEPGFKEFETSKLVESELAAVGGWSVRRVAGTGVLADLGPEGNRLLLRADMDALELQEETGLPFASEVPGMMHACGHDAHTAILLTAARLIAERKDSLKRGVRLAFQPCEETTPGGALSLIREGALEGVTGAAALHVYPQEDVGTIALRPGPMMANGDDFDIVYRGKAGHAAQPHESRDALVAAADFVSRVQGLVARRVDPFDNVVVTVGKITAGTRRNIIPSEARLEGTIRTLNAAMREKGRVLLEKAAHAAASLYEVECDFRYMLGYPVVVNHAGMTSWIGRVAAGTIGAGGIRRLPHPSMGGEDFAYYAEKVPACFFRLGSGNADPATRMSHHHPKFLIDEACLPIGAAVMATLALEWNGAPEAGA